MRVGTLVWVAVVGLWIGASAARGQTAADGRPMLDVDASDVTQSAPTAPAATGGRPKLQDVFKSLQTSTQGRSVELTPRQVMPVAAGVAGLIGAWVAIAHWKRQRRARPARPPGDHGKLMKELAKRAGVSRRQLRRLEPLAREAGLASPLVAAIAPSAMRLLAARARTDAQRMALAKLARQVARR